MEEPGDKAHVVHRPGYRKGAGAVQEGAHEVRAREGMGKKWNITDQKAPSERSKRGGLITYYIT